MSTPSNGHATNSAQTTTTTQLPESSSTSSTTPRRRTALADVAAMINGGGLGHASRSSAQPPPSAPLEIAKALDIYESQFLPHHPRSLSGIALRSFALGLAAALSLLLSLVLIYAQNPLWRAPFFVLSLSLFHFLEFYTTSLTNTSSAQVSSFLLSSNWPAYAIAHTASLIETLLTHYLLGPILPPSIHYALLALGLSLILLGQSVRAVAMLTAGSNFSHIIRHTKSQTHVLVTTGIYALFRHPSYFGFFWWGVGTQLVCGNGLCFLAYAAVLWMFFASRIAGEEELLVKFFGDEYVQYRQRTSVGIPFIR